MTPIVVEEMIFAAILVLYMLEVLWLAPKILTYNSYFSVVIIQHHHIHGDYIYLNRPESID
jgi:hypothetical protein